MQQLKNDELTVIISEHGAEMQSIKDRQGREYLWQGDAKYWGKHSPLLFPIVCGLWNETLHVDGKEYHMHRHGFGQHVDYTVISQSEERLTLALTDSEATLESYPYHFNLAITYRLEGNEVRVIWHVENTDTREIYFQIGGHPAFNVPGIAEGEKLHGFLRFDNPSPARLFGNTGGCITPDHHPVKTQDGLWEFTCKDFDDDALVFDESQIHRVELLDQEKKRVLALSFKAPALGIWSPTGKDAPFICIEPWYGIHDRVGFTGDIKDKYLINKLLPGASFMSQYTIEIE